VLFDEVRYFFYITNRKDQSPEDRGAGQRAGCDQENVIEQLKNGVNRDAVPVHDWSTGQHVSPWRSQPDCACCPLTPARSGDGSGSFLPWRAFAQLLDQVV